MQNRLSCKLSMCMLMHTHTMIQLGCVHFLKVLFKMIRFITYIFIYFLFFNI